MDSPRLEIEVPAAARDWRSVVRWSAVAIIAAGLSIVYPYGIGAAIVLPGVFGALALALLVQRPRAFTLRFFEDGLEIAHESVTEIVPWERITKVQSGPVGLDITLPFERHARVPRAHAPDDAVLREVIPATIAIEPPPVPEPRKQRDTWKTLLLWFVLIVIFYCIYAIVGGLE